jgi:hypothetical protein
VFLALLGQETQTPTYSHLWDFSFQEWLTFEVITLAQFIIDKYTTLKDAGKADEVQLKIIESNKKESIKAVERIYNKSNIRTIYF